MATFFSAAARSKRPVPLPHFVSGQSRCLEVGSDHCHRADGRVGHRIHRDPLPRRIRVRQIPYLRRGAGPGHRQAASARRPGDRQLSHPDGRRFLPAVDCRCRTWCWISTRLQVLPIRKSPRASSGYATSVNNDIHRRVWLVEITTEGDYIITTSGEVNGFIFPAWLSVMTVPPMRGWAPARASSSSGWLARSRRQRDCPCQTYGVAGAAGERTATGDADRRALR